MEKLSLDDYLYKKGVASPFSDFVFDKLRCNRQLKTMRGRKKFFSDCEKHRIEYAKKRQEVIKQYYERVEQGDIVPKTHLELTLEKANGHPDNESTQAARGILAKRGIDWRTGSPFNEKG